MSARRPEGTWEVMLRDHATGRESLCRARALVDAAGPWAGVVGRRIASGSHRGALRLVRGSHVVTRRLFDHDKAYFLQGDDGRIVFVIPYERDFTLIGTTEADHPDPDTPAVCTPEEADYLCAFVSDYFRRMVTPADIVWSYAGIRPLHDEAGGSATAASRDYALDLDADGPALLTVYGGKITTYRRLAEAALARLAPFLPPAGGAWTAGAPLPGGDFAADGIGALAIALRANHPFLDDAWAKRLLHAYGTEAAQILGDAQTRAQLGRDFGATLTEAEVRWMVDREFARTAGDIVWRRSKLGLRMAPAQVAALDDWLRAGGLSP